jgi:peptidoglycan L-alanyl-D-glutamate endopeptidase CwlK
MANKYGERSLRNRKGVHPKLLLVMDTALAKVDHTIICGVRTHDEQAALFGQGRTAAELRAKGLDPKLAKPGEPKVTWTLDTRHKINPRTGYGHAVDAIPAPFKGWDDKAGFDALYKAVMDAAKAHGVAVRSGMDWDRDGKPRERGETDSPHFELVL